VNVCTFSDAMVPFPKNEAPCGAAAPVAPDAIQPAAFTLRA
jgi:hypothetical protein